MPRPGHLRPLAERRKGWNTISQAEYYRRTKERWAFKMLRMEKPDYEIIKDLAKKRKISQAELIRTYITWGLEIDTE